MYMYDICMIYNIHELLCLCFKKCILKRSIWIWLQGELLVSQRSSKLGNCQVVPACTCAGANNEGNPWRNLHLCRFDTCQHVPLQGTHGSTNLNQLNQPAFVLSTALHWQNQQRPSGSPSAGNLIGRCSAAGFPWLTVNLCRSLQCLYHGISYFSDIVQWDHASDCVSKNIQKRKSNWIAPIHKQQVQQAIWCELSSIGGNAQGHWIRTWAIPEQASCSNIVKIMEPQALMNH